MAKDTNNQFSDLTYADFKAMAQDPSLSKYEKIGFPDLYREGLEGVIFEDIKSKLAPLAGEEKIILDIGPGCSDLPLMLIDHCRLQGHKLIFADSEEMLNLLPGEAFIEKHPGVYPADFTGFEKLKGKVDAVVVYSVIQYVFSEGNIHQFLDKTLSLLSPGGHLLIGDIPNISKRKRFFSSDRGVRFHQDYTKKNELPEIQHFIVEHENIDDAVLFGLLSRARSQGFDAYILPQNDSLPMSNRREDILIVRP